MALLPVPQFSAEEPEDNTYSLPPSNFARLSSPSVPEAHILNPDQHKKINKTTQEVQRLDPVLHKVTKTVENKQPSVQCSPKKQRVRKRRRPREEGLLSDHTYVKLKLGCQIKVGSIENEFSREEDPSLPKYSHVSIQCGESVLAQNYFHVKTPKKIKLTNSKMGFGSGVGVNLSTNEVLRSCDPKSNEKESLAEEDCNKENALSTVIKRDFQEKPHNVLVVGQRTEVKNECPNVDDCKKNKNLIMDQEFSESFPLKSSDVDQKFVTSTSSKQRKRNNFSRRNHWRQRKKKLHRSLVKPKRLVASIEANLTTENKKTDLGVANEMSNVSSSIQVCDREVRSCSNGQANAEEKFVNEEVTEPHLCLLCEELFACQESLRIHVAKHCQKSAFACIHCAKTFVDAESLRSHIATHVLHKCVLCSAELPSKSSLYEHVLSHFGETVLKCEYCPKTFYGTKLLEEHQLLHAAMSEYVCRICKKVVTTEIEYFEHMKDHLKVQSASKSFSETDPFVETAPLRHGILPIENKTINISDKFAFKNGIIGGLTVSESRKTCIGTRTRTGCQPLKADSETTKMDDNCTSLSKKMTIRGGLLCAICCKVCITEAEYRGHVLRHERVSFPGPAQGKLVIPVKCMLCERKFANERMLKEHILVHTGEFQQNCAIVQGLDRPIDLELFPAEKCGSKSDDTTMHTKCSIVAIIIVHYSYYTRERERETDRERERQTDTLRQPSTWTFWIATTLDGNSKHPPLPYEPTSCQPPRGKAERHRIRTKLRAKQRVATPPWPHARGTS
ncbi:hypothetical protein PR048_017421 [Dryococelus australis]|uniref:C2H2-type domain-containing protein n=1 Tax=Dryococelus australis TaxID=614101 RepID=A0ABQ9H9G4_9NEOP|nr:hypothetical protein PR048_017421 [Dryococelus australis]